MAERVTGGTWKELMHARLFEPLGMQAGFAWPAIEDPEQPWGHWLVDARLVPHDPSGEFHVPAVVAPAGDVHAALEDYGLFMQAHLRGLQGRESFLSPETFQRHHRPIGTYAHGWLIIDVQGSPMSVHNGSAGTFYSLAILDAERDLGIIAVTNAGHPAAQEAIDWTATEIHRILSGVDSFRSLREMQKARPPLVRGSGN